MPSTHFAAPPHKRLLAAGMDLLCVFAIATFLAPLLKLNGVDVRFETLAAVVYLIYESLFLKLWMGQSPGRRLLGTIVVRTSGGALSWLHALLRPGSRVAALIVTADLSFRHAWPDYPGDIRIPVFPFIEIGLILTNPSRRTLADYLALTVVANAPPLQPHRAPAAPMYSEHDAEFGFPPSRPRPDEKHLRRSGYAVAMLLAWLCACSPTSESDRHAREVEQLLAWSETADPARMAQADHASGRVRFLSICSYSCTPPAVDMLNAQRCYPTINVEPIRGTGDVSLSKRQQALQRRAYEVAKHYKESVLGV